MKKRWAGWLGASTAAIAAGALLVTAGGDTDETAKAGESSPALTASTVYEENRRSIFTVHIYAEDVQNMAGGELELSYDPDVLAAREFERGSRLAEEDFLFEDDNLEDAGDGQIRAAWANDTGISGSEKIASIEFRLMESEGQTSLNLNGSELYNENAEQMDPALIHGQVRPFDGTEMEETEAAGPDKAWDITLTAPVDPSTVATENIHVWHEGDDHEVPVTFDVSDDRKSFSVSGRDGFDAGDYTMYIEPFITSENGDVLEEAVKFPFTIED
ncbi:cohesin domain-containing protein [Salsuginibacillus halophilus]|uniref:Cohesin domain-containing protein n=1 Tax=Salsuginibacillus halophilus TaxID=517424 RepID=A0A2P8HQD0_9BACI|nr:cohesin domain-containing protein [Salsuginibacillus halophilus]PSL48433.1 cohesin domain-containing protein [Salsuginibacillus halophilus]